MVGRDYGYDVAAVARHLRWPEAKVQAAFSYAKAFPKEIEAALTENDAMDFESLKRMLPQAERFVVSKTTKRLKHAPVASG